MNFFPFLIIFIPVNDISCRKLIFFLIIFGLFEKRETQKMVENLKNFKTGTKELQIKNRNNKKKKKKESLN